jgi:hypothetical protein
MINLLPPEHKQAYLFARRNSVVVRAITGLTVGLAVLLLVIVGSLWFIQQETENFKNSISSTKADLKEQDEAATIARVQDISNSLKLVVSVLDQEVLFSELLRQVGTAMPSGTVLRNLSINSDLTGALDLDAGAVNYNSASQVQINLKDPKNQVFKSADIVSITCDGTDPAYPCTVSLRAEFSNDSAFMLLSRDRNQ